MPMAKEQIEELKANIAFARKREMPFGFCIGKTAETMLLVCHKTKNPEALGRQAKKEGETAKFTYGMLTCEGKVLVFNCHGDIPPGIARKIKEMLKAAGVKMKVRIADPTGNTLEEDGDDEDDAEEEAATRAETPVEADPLAEKWEAAKPKLSSVVETFLAGSPVDPTPVREAWDSVLAKAAAQDFAGALSDARGVVEQISAAKAVAERADTDRAEWEKAAAKIEPMISAAVAANAGDVKKLNAVWSFAKSKAEAAVPDFAAALKSVSMLVKLLGSARASTVAQAPEMAEAGAGGGLANGPAPAAAPPSPAAGPSKAGVDLSGNSPEKLARIDAALASITTAISGYVAVIPGSGEPVPAAWTAEVARIEGVINPLRAPGAATEVAALDLAIADLAALTAEIAAQKLLKEDWKHALDLVRIRLIPVENHPEAATIPQIKPKIDAVKAEIGKAEAKAIAHDFPAAMALLAPLDTQCDVIEALADDLANFNAILVGREAMVTPTVGNNPAWPVLDALYRQMETLLADAQADATAENFGAGLAKLNQIPAIFDSAGLIAIWAPFHDARAQVYQNTITAINTWPASVRALFTSEFAAFQVDLANALFAVTNDYVLSGHRLSAMGGMNSYLAGVVNDAKTYNTTKTAFDVQLAIFDTHAGRPGIEEFFLGMKNDQVQAQAEAAQKRFSTGTALLDRTNADWGAQTQNAIDYVAYAAKRDAVKPQIDALRGRPNAAEGVAQADALMATGATQALAKTFGAALASATEAEIRAAEAKTAADALDAMAPGATPDQRAAVLDIAYQRQKAALTAVVTTTLPPLNVGSCIQPAIDAMTALLAGGELLVQAPGYDYASAEAKLVEARAIGMKAEAEAGFWPAISATRANIVADEAALNGVAGLAAAMPSNMARLAQMGTDIDSTVAGGDLKAAKATSDEYTRFLPQLQRDFVLVGAILNRKSTVWDVAVPLISGPGNEAADALYQAAEALIAQYTTFLAAEDFEQAWRMLVEATWKIDPAKALIAAAGSFATDSAAAAAAIKTVTDIRNDAVEVAITAIEQKYQDAVNEAATGSYRKPLRVVQAIPAECVPLEQKAKDFAAYETPRAAAEAKMNEASAHAQAEAIRPLIVAIQAKYDAAIAQADGGDYAGAQSKMVQLLADATAAITTANNAAANVALADDIAGAEPGSAPDAALIARAQALYDAQAARSEAPAAKADLDDATAQLAIAKDPATAAAAARTALTKATEACTRADLIMTQSQGLVAAAADARVQVDALKSHAQASFVAEDVALMEASLMDIMSKAQTGSDLVGALGALGALLAALTVAQTVAAAQQTYLARRAEPEVEPRLEVLEKHDHSYAIRANIDAIRAKLETATTKVESRDHAAAMTLLDEVRSLGISSLVLANMRGNLVPDVNNIKAILAGPGGQAELDAIVDALEPEAQRAVLRVAFEARYGCELELFSDEARTAIIADGFDVGPNVRRFYELMSDLPPEDVVDSDSMELFSVIVGGQVSFYDSDRHEVVMREGDAATSGAYVVGSAAELGPVDPGCEPADDSPITYFSWNTLHEVGHAVDDQHGFMDANGAGAAYGGWQTHGGNVDAIADLLVTKYKYDKRYIVGKMLRNAGTEVPPVPAGDPTTPEEWEGRRIAVDAWINTAQNENDPWASPSSATLLTLGGRVYQESYEFSWTSYDAGARSKGITGYQFRAPGEWFSEVYAAFHSGKLKPSHPAYGWISAL